MLLCVGVLTCISNLGPTKRPKLNKGIVAQRKPQRFGSLPAISIQSQIQTSGEGTVRVQIDYSQVPAPEPYYVADYARIDADGATVQMVFGKLEGMNGRKLRNKLEVNIPAYAFMGQWMGSLEFIEKVKIGMQGKGFPSYHAPKEIDELTDKVQTVHANNAFVSGGENECCVDLYFLSPRDIRFYLERSETPHIEPLVRIIMEARILIGLAEGFLSIADRVRNFAPPQGMPETEEVAI
jgi:hypothetical protein